MSIKIFNAYEWTLSMNHLIPYLQKLRKDYLKCCIKVLCKNTKIKDLYLSEDFSSFVWKVTDILESEIKKNTISEENLQASVVVYFARDRVLLQFFGLDMINAFLSSEEQFNVSYSNLKDFHYQNQTELTPEEEERGLVWEKVFKSVPIPRLSGLTFALFSYGDCWNMAKWVWHSLRDKEVYKDVE